MYPGKEGQGRYDKVKAKSHQATLLSYTDVPTKYELSIPYGFWDTVHTSFSYHPPANPDTMGENNTCKVFRGCGVKLNPKII